jgi:hypothetical protein
MLEEEIEIMHVYILSISLCLSMFYLQTGSHLTPLPAPRVVAVGVQVEAREAGASHVAATGALLVLLDLCGTVRAAGATLSREGIKELLC